MDGTKAAPVHPNYLISKGADGNGPLDGPSRSILGLVHVVSDPRKNIPAGFSPFEDRLRVTNRSPGGREINRVKQYSVHDQAFEETCSIVAGRRPCHQPAKPKTRLLSCWSHVRIVPGSPSFPNRRMPRADLVRAPGRFVRSTRRFARRADLVRAPWAVGASSYRDRSPFSKRRSPRAGSRREGSRAIEGSVQPKRPVM